MTILPLRALPTGLLALTLLAMGCGGDGAAGGSNATVTDSAGIRMVENSGSGEWAPDDRWSVEEIFRVGGLEAGSDAQFGAVISVDADPAGRVYVADQQARQVSIYSPEGELLSRAGSPGEGPGEIGAMFMGMFERNGEIWTIDPGSQGIQRFDRSGEFLGATPFNIMGGIPIRMDEIDSGVVAQRRSMGMDGSTAGGGDAITTIGSDATDTLMTLPVGEGFSMQGGLPQYHFFAPEPIWDVADDGSTVRGMNSVYRFEIRNPVGELTTIVMRDVAQQPVSETARRKVLEGVREMMIQAGAPPQAVEPILQQATFAESFPPAAQVLLEADGHLWVQRTGQLAEVVEEEDFDMQDLGAPVWDVFDADGIYLGRLDLPGRFQPLRMIDGVLWGIDRDEFGAPSVVGMRVVR
jgi:hypothetical protein